MVNEFADYYRQDNSSKTFKIYWEQDSTKLAAQKLLHSRLPNIMFAYLTQLSKNTKIRLQAHPII